MKHFTNNRIIKLQAKIVYLSQLIAVRQYALAKRKQQNLFSCSDERLASNRVLQALSHEIEVISQQYRECLFGLMVSGISHAAYQQFIERLDGPCLVWNH